MTGYDKNTDRELLELIRVDDQRAFKALYERYWTTLWSYARNAMADADDAEDIVQELFTTIWEKRASMKVTSSLRAYLFRATLNRVIDRIDRSRYQSTYLDDLKRTYDEGNYAIDANLFEQELMCRFEACMGKMPPKMRTIFSLSRLEQMTHQQISDYLEISRDNVNRQIKNALIILKRSLLGLVIIIHHFLA